jgi:photosystem II stability/assembly factor-like uncharacterized protein
MKNNITILVLLFSLSASAQSWKTLPFDQTTHQDKYNDLYFHSETNGHMVGDNWSYLKTFDAGKTWIKKDISSLHDSVFTRVIFLDDSVGFIQGVGRFYKTLNGGNSWTTINLGVYRNQIGISNGQVFAYGDSGFGGLYFSRYFPANDSFHTQNGAWSMYDLEKLVYIGDSTIIIAKDTGKIYRSTDLGKTFVLVANNLDLNKNFNSQVRDIYFKDQDTGFISYRHWGLAHTVDGGVNWIIDSTYYNNSLTRFVEWKNKVYFVAGTANILYSDHIYFFEGTNLKSDTTLKHQDFRNTNFQLLSTNQISLYTGIHFNFYYKSPLSLGIKKQNRHNLKSYPNPSSGEFTVELPNQNTTDLTIEIINSLGQQLNPTYTFARKQLNFTLDESGIHFIQIYEKNRLIYSGKLIVQ